MPARRRIGAIVGLIASLGLGGCAGFGPARFMGDEINYSTALGQSQSDQTLLNIIRIRYGESAVFLNTTQIISGYQLQHSFTPSLTLFPNIHAGDSFLGSGTVQIQQNPTFTIEPVTGEALARSIIRPLSPAELLPLSLSSLPVDILFRLAVQSVNGLQNSEMVASVNRPGSPQFYQLIVDLRRLQMAALLGVRLEAGAPGKSGEPAAANRLILTVSNTEDPALQKTVLETRALLGMQPGAQAAEVVYGSRPQAPGQIAILTRPILGVLRQVASEIEVPEADVRQGITVGTFRDSSVFHRPAVVVHTGAPQPPGAFAQIDYHGRRFWIANDDFDSKVAYSVVQLLLTLAQTKPSSGTLVTIPAR